MKLGSPSQWRGPSATHGHPDGGTNETVATVIAVIVLGAASSIAAAGTSVLFIGNSFTYGWGSPVRFYRAHTVTDLNGEGIGGVPALFKVFTVQAGLEYDVYLETRSGSGLDFHLANKRDLIATRPWDIAVMHGQSTLDLEKPGDPTKLIATTRQMVDLLRARNPNVADPPHVDLDARGSHLPRKWAVGR